MVTWVQHVKDCQKKMGLSYKEAMSNIDCRNAYKEIKQQKEAPVSKSKETAYAQRRQRGLSVDRLKIPVTTIQERRIEEFRKILKVNRQKYAKMFGKDFTDQAALSRGQAAEQRRIEKPPVPRRRKMTDVEFEKSISIRPTEDEEIALAAKKLFAVARGKRTQPKLTPKGAKRVPKKK